RLRRRNESIRCGMVWTVIVNSVRIGPPQPTPSTSYEDSDFFPQGRKRSVKVGEVFLAVNFPCLLHPLLRNPAFSALVPAARSCCWLLASIPSEHCRK